MENKSESEIIFKTDFKIRSNKKFNTSNVHFSIDFSNEKYDLDEYKLGILKKLLEFFIENNVSNDYNINKLLILKTKLFDLLQYIGLSEIISTINELKYFLDYYLLINESNTNNINLKKNSKGKNQVENVSKHLNYEDTKENIFDENFLEYNTCYTLVSNLLEMNNTSQNNNCNKNNKITTLLKEIDSSNNNIIISYDGSSNIKSTFNSNTSLNKNCSNSDRISFINRKLSDKIFSASNKDSPKIFDKILEKETCSNFEELQNKIEKLLREINKENSMCLSEILLLLSKYSLVNHLLSELPSINDINSIDNADDNQTKNNYNKTEILKEISHSNDLLKKAKDILKNQELNINSSFETVFNLEKEFNSMSTTLQFYEESLKKSNKSLYTSHQENTENKTNNEYLITQELNNQIFNYNSLNDKFQSYVILSEKKITELKSQIKDLENHNIELITAISNKEEVIKKKNKILECYYENSLNYYKDANNEIDKENDSNKDSNENISLDEINLLRNSNNTVYKSINNFNNTDYTSILGNLNYSDKISKKLYKDSNSNMSNTFIQESRVNILELKEIKNKLNEERKINLMLKKQNMILRNNNDNLNSSIIELKNQVICYKRKIDNIESKELKEINKVNACPLQSIVLNTLDTKQDNNKSINNIYQENKDLQNNSLYLTTTNKSIILQQINTTESTEEIINDEFNNTKIESNNPSNDKNNLNTNNITPLKIQKNLEAKVEEFMLSKNKSRLEPIYKNSFENDLLVKTKKELTQNRSKSIDFYNSKCGISQFNNINKENRLPKIQNIEKFVSKIKLKINNKNIRKLDFNSINKNNNIDSTDMIYLNNNLSDENFNHSNVNVNKNDMLLKPHSYSVNDFLKQQQHHQSFNINIDTILNKITKREHSKANKNTLKNRTNSTSHNINHTNNNNYHKNSTFNNPKNISKSTIIINNNNQSINNTIFSNLMKITEQSFSISLVTQSTLTYDNLFLSYNIFIRKFLSACKEKLTYPIYSNNIYLFNKENNFKTKTLKNILLTTNTVYILNYYENFAETKYLVSQIHEVIITKKFPNLVIFNFSTSSSEYLIIEDFRRQVLIDYLTKLSIRINEVTYNPFSVISKSLEKSITKILTGRCFNYNKKIGFLQLLVTSMFKTQYKDVYVTASLNGLFVYLDPQLEPYNIIDLTNSTVIYRGSKQKLEKESILNNDSVIIKTTINDFEDSCYQSDSGLSVYSSKVPIKNVLRENYTCNNNISLEFEVKTFNSISSKCTKNKNKLIFRAPNEYEAVNWVVEIKKIINTLSN